MTNYDLYEDVQEENGEKIDFLEWGLKFLSKWPWFVFSIVVCLLVALGYLYFATPEYNVSSSIVINDTKKGGRASMDMALFDGMGFSGASGNVDNEVIILSSLTNVQAAVKDLGLYTSYEIKNGLKYSELYPQSTSPLTVNLIDKSIEDLKAAILLTVFVENEKKITVECKTGKEEKTLEFNQFPIYFATQHGAIEVLKNTSHALVGDGTTYKIAISPLVGAARAYKSGLEIAPASKTTSIINLSLKSTNRQRGIDFLDHLITVYNRNTNADKNEVAQKTFDFLTERLELIKKDLEEVESGMAAFKKGAQLTDVSLAAQMSTQQYSMYEQKKVENATQLNLVSYLKDYMNNTENKNQPVPANIMSDGSLNSQVNKYNEMLSERKRLERASTENNPALINLENSIEAIYSNIIATINNIENSLLITRDNLEKEAERYNQRIMAAPTQEKTLVGIEREQEILANIYLLLLQKKEENATALAATTDNAKFIDKAIAGGMVSPKRNMILLAMLLVGLFIPIAIILLKEWMQFKIMNQSDVSKITSAPVLGVISQIKDTESTGTLLVKRNENNRVTEEFRAIRANLQFMSGADRQVIMLTSSMSGEGKSFIAANLAVSISLLKKKVILIGLDLRRPTLLKIFEMESETGISQYLADSDSCSLKDLVLHVEDNRYLDIIPAGPIPPNATELLATPALGKAIEQLKQEYDYIVLDTAPVGLVADTLALGRYVDVSIYICRADYTHKKDFEYLEELRQKKLLPGLCTILNAYDLDKNKYYGKYGYGYGAKKYGYE